MCMVNMAREVQDKMDNETRTKSLSQIAEHFYANLDLQRDIKGALVAVRCSRTTNAFIGTNFLMTKLLHGRHFGSYVTGAYLFVKFVYLIQVVAQLFILNRFIAPDYTFWGFEIVRDIFQGREWQESGHFPRLVARSM